MRLGVTRRTESAIARGINRTIAAMVLTGMTAICCDGSVATPPQCAPPMFDGMTSVPSRLGGVNGPSFRSAAIRSAHAARPDESVPKASAAVMCCGDRGPMALAGWVGHASSPATVDFGTARSSTGTMGTPVSRSSTKSCPVFVACSTASRARPPYSTRTSAGGDALS